MDVLSLVTSLALSYRVMLSFLVAALVNSLNAFDDVDWLVEVCA